MPELVVKKGPGRGDVLTLGNARMTVGRAPDNDVHLDDRTVSRYHAVLTEREGEWHLTDLGSNNGTLVNGQPVVTSRLEHLDEIHLGNVVMSFRDDEVDQPETAVEQKRPHPEITQAIRLDDLGPALAPARTPGTRLIHRDRRLDYLLAVAELAASVRSVATLFDGVVQSLRGTVRADRVIPILEDDDILRPYLESSQDFGDTLDDLGIDVSLIERCRREGIAAVGRSTDPILHVAAVPIRVGVRNIGMIYCERSQPSVAFTEDDLRYLLAGSLLTGVAIENIRSRESMTRRAQSLSRQLEQHYSMVGESEVMAEVYRIIRKAAPTDAGVLICGESGTGKEMVARAVHLHSQRKDGPLETVNCGAVPATLMEAELFGHVKGAFTGAVADKPGRFELADGGTLFLDEVVELSPECQTKLLRALEEGHVRRIGDIKDRSVDVRLIAATNRDLDQAIAEGRLRQDLFYRLDRLRIVVPPLRERAGDIEILAQHFLQQLGRSLKRPVQAFAPEVMEVFDSYDWPGNVRELRNVVERMVILADGPLLGLELIPDDLKAAAGTDRKSTVEPLRDMEKQQIIRALQETGGNKQKAAQMLGIDRSTLYKKLKRYGMNP